MAVIDSNIIIDYLSGFLSAKKEMEFHRNPAVSIITWIEVLVGAKSKDEAHFARDYLAQFQTIGITDEVAEQSIALRKSHKLRLPDAIIWATALAQNTVLVTRNTKAFPKDDPSIRIPYR